MTIATVLFYTVARHKWGWSRLAAGLPVSLFLALDLAFFGANISKITHGAWFPLLIGAIVFFLMTTWRKGRDLLADRINRHTLSLDDFLAHIATDPPPRVEGKAVYLAGSQNLAPPALIWSLKHHKVLHEEVAVLTILTAELPRVPREEKLKIETPQPGIHRITARFGFMEEPNVPYVLALARETGPDFPLQETSFFLGREKLLPAKRRPSMPVWRNRVFAFMSRNALGATTYFQIPPDRVVEVGAQIEL